MFTTLVSVVALIVLILPGFVCSRAAAGRRAQPASITDLELVLRSLGYALLVHGIYVASGWTPCLIDKILDAGSDWEEHRLEALGFAAAVFATAAILGYLIGELLRWLDGVSVTHAASWKGRVGFALFHGLGGQDARDAFDYVLERRRNSGKSFIVVIRVQATGDNDDGLRVGLYGPKSYYGASPRPHDIHLQEVWKVDGPRRLKRVKPAHEAWYKADEIKDIWFREITEKEIGEGVVREFARGGIGEMLKQHRAAYARDIIREALQREPKTLEEARADAKSALEAVASLGEDASYDEAVAVGPQLIEAAGSMLAAAGQSSEFGIATQEGTMRIRIETARHNRYDWKLWQRILEYYVSLPEHDLKWEAQDAAAHLAIGAMWIDDLDPSDWDDSDEVTD